MVTTTLKLGISILNGGNSEVQQVCVHKTNPLDYVILNLKHFLWSPPSFLLENAGVLEG